MRPTFLLLFTLFLLSSLSAQLLPQERELLYVHTDRTLYQPGETVWLRAYLTDLQLRLHTPLSDVVTIQLLDPAGTVIQTVNIHRSTSGHDGYLRLHNQLKGGRYTLRAYTNWLGNFGEAAFFTKYLYLQDIKPPGLLLELEPERESYAPGTNVHYTFTARNRLGEPLANHPVSAALRIDGEIAQELPFQTDPAGITDITFLLPLGLTTDDVQLSVTVRADGDVSSVLRPVRVLLQDITLQLFPEGGQRSAADHKIAFRATNRHGKPLDVSGRIVSGAKTVLTFRSQHNGYGHFILSPPRGRQQKLLLDQFPDTSFALPEVGFMAVPATASFAGDQVMLDIDDYSGAGFFNLTLQREDSIMRVQQVFTGRTVLSLAGAPPGVYSLRLDDETGRPRWERRFFRRPPEVAMADLTATRINGSAAHTFTLTDAKGAFVNGNFSVAIVDDRPHTQQNDKQPHLVAQLLLQSQLTGTLYEPNDYFDPDQPQAMAALDDVLLCHGWRAYEWSGLNNFPYSPLQTGLNGFVTKGYNGAKARKHLKFNGEILQPDEDGMYRKRLPPMSSLSLNPAVYYYRNTRMEEITYLQRKLIQALPIPQLYSPPKAAAQRRRVQVPKTTTWSKEQMTAPVSVETERSESGSQVLNEVVVVGYSQAMKATASGVVIRTTDQHNGTEYNIRNYESALYRPNYFFKPTPTVPLQIKTAFHQKFRFNYQKPANGAPPRLLLWAPQLSKNNQNKYLLHHRAPQLSATYRIIIEGISATGMPVHLEETISTKAPLEFIVQMPSHAVVGDTLLLNAIVRNNTDAPVSITEAFTASEAFHQASLQQGIPEITVAAQGYRTLTKQLIVQENQGTEDINWQISTSQKTLEHKASVKLHPRLFTHLSSASSAGGRELEVHLAPSDYTGEITAELRLYGNSFDQIIQSYAGMLREPHGCFEQVTSTSYPNALIVGLLREDSLGQRRSLLRRARGYLASGYQQLSRYEQQEGGFGLWKNSMAKPRYSAMALLQFADLAKVWDGVNPAMIKRTRRFLSEYLRETGFREGPAQLYQILALARYQDPGLEALIAQHAKAVASQPREHYYALLLTRVYLATGQMEEARTQVQRLVPVVLGHRLNAKAQSAGIGSSYGRFSKVEMLGYFVESYLATEGYDGTAEEAFRWATELKSTRSYQPTQAKVRYLRALAALARYRPQPEAGYLEVFVNDSRTDTIRYAIGRSRTVLLRLTPHLRAGSNRVRLRFAEREHYPPLQWQAKWQSVLPPQTDAPPLTVTLRADTAARVGDIVSYRLELTNTTDTKVNSPMLQVGLPGNVSLLAKDLDPLIDQGIIDYYELDGQYLQLYFEGFAAGERRIIPLDLTARIAGTFHAPPLVCYPYYQPHLRQFLPGIVLRVTE